jgi:hypothetical protein
VAAASATPVSDETAIAVASTSDPATSTQLSPVKHLDPLQPPPPPDGNGRTIIPVATLEANYETVFCGLSQSLGVTLHSPQSLEKIAFIASQEATGHFDLLAHPISNNPLGVTGVSFEAIDYDTTVTLPPGVRTFHVSGGLLMPVGIDRTKVKGIVVYFHGTTFNKSMVGSSWDSGETQLMAELFASQGYIVAIPDYVGQGIDWQDVHPYVLYPTVSAKTAVDMLAAVKPLIRARFGFLDQAGTLKLFSAGYSEGGSYSVWFNSFISSTPGVLDAFYTLIHSVGMEGAYDTRLTTKNYLFHDVNKQNGNPFNIQSQFLVNIVKPLLSADAFLSYATWSQNSDYLSIVNEKFFNLECDPLLPQSLCDVGGQNISIAQAFAMPDTNVSTPILSAALGKRGNGATYPFDLPFAEMNSINALVTSQLLEPPAQLALDQTLRAADADLTPVAARGVSIFSLAQDSVVVPNNFDQLLALYPSKIDTAIKVDEKFLPIVSPFSSAVGHAVFVPADHLHGLIYEFIYALHVFDTH